MKPLIVVNLKTYKQGKEVVKLVKKIEKVSKDILLGVQALDIYEVKKKTRLKIYAQHVDWQEKGRATGFILPEAVKKDGAVGVFLNHSEHKLRFDVLKKTMARCRKLKLKTLVFAKDLKEALKIKKLKPDYIAVEPPELVGGKVSVSKARPELIKNISKKLKRNFLVGAGVKTKEDVVRCLELGASGVAVSSGVVKAKNPEKVLKEFLSIEKLR